MQLYRYQEFEMSKIAKMPGYYPKEAPNTSYFHGWHQQIWTTFGLGKQNLWLSLDYASRRYETTYQLVRRLLMISGLYYYGAFHLFPFILRGIGDEYGPNPDICQATHFPFDNLYIERGFSTLDPEWLRHIHSKASC